MSDLKLVKTEGIFKLTKRFFNAPSERINTKDIFRKKVELVSNKDMKGFVVFIRPFIKNKKDFDWNRAIFEFRFETVVKNIFRIFFRLDTKRFKFVGIEFLKNRDPIRSFKVLPGFGFGMSKTDAAIGFDFGDKFNVSGANKFN